MRKFLTAVCAAMLILAPSSFAQLKTKTAEQKGTYPLEEGSKWNISLDLSVEYVLSGLGKSQMTEINKTIGENIFGANYSGTIPEMLRKYKDDALKELREGSVEAMKELAESGAQINSFSCFHNIKGCFTGSYGNWRSYEVTTVYYDGGAMHPQESKTGSVFDIRTGKELTPEDIFLPGYDNTLSILLFRHKFDGEKHKNEYFDDRIISNGNFTVSSKGVTYIYNPYEIAPASCGIIEVTIPWSELKSILNK